MRTKCYLDNPIIYPILSPEVRRLINPISNYPINLTQTLTLSFKKITALILCISFMLGAISLVFANTDSINKAVKYAQTNDKSGELENNSSEEFQDKKIDYLLDQSLISFNFIHINNKYEPYSKGSISFLSYPPFSPPKA